MKVAKKLSLGAALVFAAFGIVRATRVIYSTNLVNESALAYNNTYSLDLGGGNLRGSNIDSVSFQAVYSSATISAVSFTDGKASTGTITVSSYTALIGAKATNSLLVKSTSTLASLSNVYFTLNGINFYRDDLWSVGTSSIATSLNLCNAVTNYAYTAGLVTCSTSTTPGAATFTAKSNGAYGNSYTIVSSTPNALAAGSATFTGGVNDAFIVIGGTVLNNGTDFTAASSSGTTGISISSSITNNATLGALITASTDSTKPGIVSVTAKGVGAVTNYSWFSSSNNALAMSNRQLYGGTDSAIDTSAGRIKVTNHGFTKALPVYLTVVSGTAPGTLVSGTTYYVIPVDANSFKMASSSANALLGTAVGITTQTATGGGSFTLTPSVYSGTPSFKWQVSNDNANWVDFTATLAGVSISSVTVASPTYPSASTTWDFGRMNYRYIRLNVLGPSAGGLKLTVIGSGKSND